MGVQIVDGLRGGLRDAWVWVLSQVSEHGARLDVPGAPEQRDDSERERGLSAMQDRDEARGGDGGAVGHPGVEQGEPVEDDLFVAAGQRCGDRAQLSALEGRASATASERPEEFEASNAQGRAWCVERRHAGVNEAVMGSLLVGLQGGLDDVEHAVLECGEVALIASAVVSAAADVLAHATDGVRGQAGQGVEVRQERGAGVALQGE